MASVFHDVNARSPALLVELVSFARVRSGVYEETAQLDFSLSPLGDGCLSYPDFMGLNSW